MSLLGEIKRRKVFQVAAVYAVVAWLIIQIIDVVSEPLSLPVWLDTVVIVLLAVGFPVAVILAWAFDLTPEGVVKDTGTVQSGGRRIEYVLIGLLVVSMGWVLYRVEISPSVAPTVVDSAPTPEVIEEETASDVLPNSVAVLLFENLSPDPDDEYFAPGIHDELLNQLVKVRDLTVISRTSVLKYPNSGKTVAEIAAELNVEAIMEGTVRYAGDRVRITAQLIDPATGGHLWSETYEYEFAVENIFTIESDIAVNIAMALEAELLPSELARIESLPTASNEAYGLYLRALSLPSVAVYPDFLPTHLAYLDEAIALDGTFALAHAEKAMNLARGDDLEQFAEGRQSAEQALRIDPSVGLAYLAIAQIERKLLNATAARIAVEEAFRLSPNDAEVLIEYSRFLSYVEEHERAIEVGNKAVQIDPNSPGLYSRFSGVVARSGDTDGAVRVAQRAVQADPGRPSAHSRLALAEIARGNNDAALESLVRADQLWPAAPAWGITEMAYVYGRLGRSEDVFRQADRLEDLLDGIAPDVMHEVLFALAVRDSAQALSLLEDHILTMQGASDPFDVGFLASIKANEFNDPILDQPEFVEVRSRLGFRE